MINRMLQAINKYQLCKRKLDATLNTILLQSGDTIKVELTDEYQEILNGIMMRKSNGHIEIKGDAKQLTINHLGKRAIIQLN